MSQQRKIDFDKIRKQFEEDSEKILRHHRVTNDDTALLKPSVPQKPLNVVKRAPSMMTLPRAGKIDHRTIKLRPMVPPKPIKKSNMTPTPLSPVSPGADSLYESMYETIGSVNEFKFETLPSEKPENKSDPLRQIISVKPVLSPKPFTPTKPITAPSFEQSIKLITSVKPTNTSSASITSQKPITSPKPPITPPKPSSGSLKPGSTLVKPTTAPPKPPINNETKINALKSSLRLDLPNLAKSGSVESALSGSSGSSFRSQPVSDEVSTVFPVWKLPTPSPELLSKLKARSCMDLYEESEKSERGFKAQSEKIVEQMYEYIEEPAYDEPVIHIQSQRDQVRISLEDTRMSCARIINDLIETEEIYISQLQIGINLYLKPMMKIADGPILLNQVKMIFRNIEEIFELHQRSILPLFRNYHDDPVNITYALKQLINSNTLEVYPEFCSGKQKADEVCAQQWQFFEDAALEKRASLNIEDFLILPLHVLPKYHSTFEKLIEVYGGTFSCSDDIKLVLKDFEYVKAKLEDLMQDMNQVQVGVLEDRVYTPLTPNFKLESNIEIDIQAGVQRTLSLVNDAMDISLLRNDEKTQLLNIIRELIQVEKNYIENLQRLVDIYVNSFNQHAKTIRELRGKKYHVFANLHLILSFHKNLLLPGLQSCNEDLIQITKLFNKHINDGNFYPYILYSFNKPRTQTLTITHQKFFGEIQMKHNDRQGINSYLMQPIQILPRYVLLFRSMIKTLTKDIHMIKKVEPSITACCIVEKQLQRVLDTINEALRLSEVDAIYDIDIYDQGRFLRMDEFEVDDEVNGKTFYAKVFLFEKCVVFVKMSDLTDREQPKEKLRYKFSIQRSDISGIQTDNKSSLILALIGARCLMLSGDMIRIQTWTRLLSQTHTKKTSIEVSLVDYSPKSPTGTLPSGRRKSTVGTLGKKSRFLTSTLRIKRKLSKKISFDNNNSGDKGIYQIHPLSSTKTELHGSKGSLNTICSSEGSATDFYDYSYKSWEDRKSLEVLKNAEKHYVWTLNTYNKLYLTWLPLRDREALSEFLRLFDNILRYHKEIMSISLFRDGLMVNRVCEIIHKSFEDELYSIYVQYAIHQPFATEILKKLYSKSENIRLDLVNPVDQASLLPVEAFSLLPIQHIYKLELILIDLVGTVMKVVDQDRDVDEGLTKWLVNLQVLMTKYSREVNIHHRLNSVRNTSISVKDYGLIKYSDLVTMEGTEKPGHRIFLMKNGIIAARINFEKDGSESYTSFVWVLGYEGVRYKVSISQNRRLKLWSKSSNNQKYRVTFCDLEKQDLFLQLLEQQMRKCQI